MIRLTDEEIRRELVKLPDTNLFLPSAYEESSIGWNEFIAKAQLKKVGEWGDEDCTEHAVEARKSLRRGLESIGRAPVYPRRECYTCWQVLLEEIK